jgi:hypothetical protein
VQSIPLLACGLKIASIVAVLTITLATAQARVGETAHEIETRYGKPAKEKRQRAGIISREYRHGGFRVVVGLRDGICYAERYQKIPPTPFRESEISALLREHSGGGKWEQIKADNLSAIVIYRGSESRAAIHDTLRHTLDFSKEQFVMQKTMSRADAGLPPLERKPARKR